MAASRIPPEVFEMVLQFAPDNGLVGFKVDKRELQEDAKITTRKDQFGPISIRSPNQLRLLNRIALAYVRNWKSSKLLCEIWMKSDEEDFSKAEVALSFLHSNAVPIVLRIIRKAAVLSEKAFQGLPDLALSYYSEQIAQIDLHVHIADSSVHLAQFCRWFHSFWLYVLEKIPAAADLPTFVDLSCQASVFDYRYLQPGVVEQNLSERGVFQEIMPNNFQRLDFSQLREAFEYYRPGENRPEPLLSGCADFIFNACRGTIKHVAGSLPDILSLGFQSGAAFPAVVQIDAFFNERFRFSGGVNPIAQLVSRFPSLESLNLYARHAGDHQVIAMDLSPLLGASNLKHFQFGGNNFRWTQSYVEQFTNEPLSRWNVSHPGVRSIRLVSAEMENSDEMPAGHIVALSKLLDLNATSYDCLDLHNVFSVRQVLAILNAYAIFPKVVGLRRLSMIIDYTTQRNTEERLESIARLFALIERNMPNFSALCLDATRIGMGRVAPDAGAFEFARSPEIALLSRFVANLPKQLKELTLKGILEGPVVYVPEKDEQWLLCTLRCLIESNLSCLVVTEAASCGIYWPLPFFQRWRESPGSIKDLFKSLPPAATKGKRLQSVKFYTRKREVEFPHNDFPRNVFLYDQAVELRCVLANASTGETQTLRMRAAARMVS